MTATEKIFAAISWSPDAVLVCRAETARLALAYWQDLRGERTMPALGDLDVLEMPRTILPNVGLIDIEYGPQPRYRWRLIGTAITATLGRDMTGRYWDEVYAEDILQMFAGPANQVQEHHIPVRFTGRAHVPGKEIYDTEHLYMPLSDGGGRVARIFMVTVFDLHAPGA